MKKDKMTKKIIFIPLVVYFLVDIIEIYSKDNYLWIKVVLVMSIIIIGFYLKVIKGKK